MANAFTEKGLAFDKEVFLQSRKFDFDFDFVKEIKRKENRLEGTVPGYAYTFDDETTEIDVLLGMLTNLAASRATNLRQGQKSFLTVDRGNLSVHRRAEVLSRSLRRYQGFNNRLKQNMKLNLRHRPVYFKREKADFKYCGHAINPI